MDDRKMEVIKQLMDELQDLMSPSGDDFASRLGRVKPEVEMKIEAEPMEEGEDMEMGEGMPIEEEEPEEKLKARLMKIRG